MTRQVLAALVLLSLVACARTEAPTTAAAESYAPAQSAKGEAPSVNRYLAYEHYVSIEADNDGVVALFNAAQNTCREAVAESCAVLDARISTGDVATASLKFRAKAEGIKKLIAVLSTQGKIESQSTSAEDLAGPIEDTAKQLSMRKDYRDKLEALRGRAGNDIDTLIKLNRELAQVQSEIEGLSGQQAQLVQRVETEILNVSISAYANRSFWAPIAESGASFGHDLSDGISTAITALAYLIPWSLVFLLIFWVARKLWKRSRRPRVES